MSQPFSLNRFEQGARHVYYLPHSLTTALPLGHRRPAYLVGARGTGKTTFLKALDWRERVSNNQLMNQLKLIGVGQFQGTDGEPFIGVYLKVPSVQLCLIEQWLAKASRPDDTAGAIIAFYLDLLWLEELLDAVQELALAKVLRYTPGREMEVARAIAGKYPGTIVPHLKGSTPTIIGLRDAFRSARSGLQNAAYTDVSPSVALEGLDGLGQPGTFGQAIASRLSELCSTGKAAKKAPWQFRVCLDEGEALTRLQLLTINTMVRLCEWPLSYVVAFVSTPRHAAQTLMPSLTLQTADRDVADLGEYMERSGFQAFCEGVAAVRLEWTAGDSTPHLDLERLLGRLSINRILEDVLKESVSPKAKDLLSRAEELREEFFVREPDIDTPLPIYQAYLIDELSLSTPDASDANWKQRRHSSAELRKRMVAAYLSICDEHRTATPYASVEMVLQLSDLCIRDFLRFIHHMHVESGRDLAHFLVTSLNWKEQTSAIHSASEEKWQRRFEEALGSPREIELIVTGLGYVTAKLQRGSVDGSHLRSSERGIFVLGIDESIRAEGKQLVDLVVNAAEAGFLTLLEHANNKLRFRLHCSMAPVFGLSYRGAYYDYGVAWSDIDRMRRASNEAELDAIANSMTTAAPRHDELSLFGEDV